MQKVRGVRVQGRKGAGRKGVVLRTLATRGRKRAGPTSAAQWEGWSEAEGPKDNTPYDLTINRGDAPCQGQS